MGWMKTAWEKKQGSRISVSCRLTGGSRCFSHLCDHALGDFGQSEDVVDLRMGIGDGEMSEGEC